jgi:hypothetical protein
LLADWRQYDPAGAARWDPEQGDLIDDEDG